MTATTTVCRGCGGPLLPARGPGRPVVWCSERCRKAQYSRPCADCGRPMNGSGGRGERAPVRCSPCQNRTIEQREAMSRAHSGRVVWSDEDLLDALRACHEDIGPPVTRGRYRAWRTETSAPSHALIIGRLGGWSRACEQAGVPHGQQRRTSYGRTTAEECVEAVAEAARIVGRPPTVSQYAELRRAHPGWPSESLIRIRCGPWMAVVRAIDQGEAR